MIAQIYFDNSINSSLQVGDIVYFAVTSNSPGSNIVKSSTADIKKLGIVKDIVHQIGNSYVEVDYDELVFTGLPVPAGAYIMFEKDKKVNSASLIGYYAEIKLVNNSNEKATLFSLGSEISESSK